MRKPVIVEEIFESDIQSLWNAITELEEMTQWYFENIPSFNAHIGFETAFNITSTNRNFFHQWKVTDVVPLQQITYQWTYKNISGSSFSSFELFEKKDKQTKLRVTCTGLETFPKDIS